METVQGSSNGRLLREGMTVAIIGQAKRRQVIPAQRPLGKRQGDSDRYPRDRKADIIEVNM